MFDSCGEGCCWTEIPLSLTEDNRMFYGPAINPSHGTSEPEPNPDLQAGPLSWVYEFLYVRVPNVEVLMCLRGESADRWGAAPPVTHKCLKSFVCEFTVNTTIAY